MEKDLQNKVDALMAELDEIKVEYVKRLDNDGKGSEGSYCEEDFEEIDMIIELIKKYVSNTC